MSERSPGARDLDTLVERAARLTAPEDFGRRVQSRLDDGTAGHTPRPRLARLVLAGAATAALVAALLVWTPWREPVTPPADVVSSAGSGADIGRTDLPRSAGSIAPVATGSARQRSPRVASGAFADGSGRATRRANTAAVTAFDETGVGMALDVDAWTRLRPEPIHVAPIEVASLDDHQGLEVDPIHVAPIEIDPLAHPAPIGQSERTP